MTDGDDYETRELIEQKTDLEYETRKLIVMLSHEIGRQALPCSLRLQIEELEIMLDLRGTAYS